MRYISQLLKIPVTNYDDLYHWSITNIEEFWKSIWILSGIISSSDYDRIITGGQMFGTKWFAGAELNFAENLLRYRDNHHALISSREDCPNIRITYNDLYLYVSSCADYLKKIGIKRGDRIAGFVSNTPETVIAMLAVTSIGAIWSSGSPDFGLQGVLDRFGQIKPEVLFAVESYQYNGQIVDCTSRIGNIVERIPEIKKVVIIDRLFDFNFTQKSGRDTSSKSEKYVYFEEIIKTTSSELEFEQNPFDHPVYIMYSSGTTGIPKCIVHVAGGTLLQHYKELSLHSNLSRHDVITYYTTCGWMMWNWLVSSLQIGATIFLYDGNHAYPNIKTLWQKIEEERISVFGTSPKFLSACQKSNLIPKEIFNLNSLKTILSTGSPLSVENFEYVYSCVKTDVQLSSISGGTDIISCFALGNPNIPVYAGEIQCRGLGMKVEAFDEKGNSVLEKKGELVCSAPFPSMPIYFWKDPEGEKYRATYFDFYPGIWRHGDFIKITERGGVVIYGRSDATLNPGGVRIGTAEIYRVVEAMNEVTDSIVIGQEWKNDVRIVLFVVLKEGMSLTKELTEKIKEEIRISVTPRHVPFRIFKITDVPRTISGKKVEIAVKKIIHGERINNRDALANPESLDQFKNFIFPLSN